ncbi:MAG: hypothetical protein LBV47_01225 [Bacteroidales bacterium]|jgi:hypothetical protein|nr:hypothetical protein [Bacteroidales bacterium]
MKIRIVLCLIIVAFSAKVNLFGQGAAVVNDPVLISTTIANWGESLAKTTEQIGILKKNADMMRETVEMYKKINNAFKSSQMVYSIMDNQVKIISEIDEAMKFPQKEAASPAMYQAYIKRLLSLAERNKANIQMMKDVLTDNVFKMDDAARLDRVEKMEERTSQLLTQLSCEKERFDSANTNVKLVKALEKK